MRFLCLCAWVLATSWLVMTGLPFVNTMIAFHGPCVIPFGIAGWAYLTLQVIALAGSRELQPPKDWLEWLLLPVLAVSYFAELRFASDWTAFSRFWSANVTRRRNRPLMRYGKTPRVTKVGTRAQQRKRRQSPRGLVSRTATFVIGSLPE